MKINIEKKPKSREITATSVIAYTVTTDAPNIFYGIVMETISPLGITWYQINRLSSSTLLIEPEPTPGDLARALDNSEHVVTWELLDPNDISITIKQ